VDVYRPADDTAAEGVDDDGEEGELLAQPQVGDVRYPELIETRHLHAPREIGDH